jgi:hypothetical protein
MRIRRILAILLGLIAGLETAAAQHNARLLRAPAIFEAAPLRSLSEPIVGESGAATQYGERSAQQNQQLIGRSMALRLALSYSPGSQGLGVDLVDGRRIMYAVKLKTGNRVHRVLVDARTGQILGE